MVGKIRLSIFFIDGSGDLNYLSVCWMELGCSIEIRDNFERLMHITCSLMERGYRVNNLVIYFI